jgi:DNA recombination protein RmuC
VLTQAKRFEMLKVETGGKSIEAIPVIESSPRPLTKLSTMEQDDDLPQIAAE